MVSLAKLVARRLQAKGSVGPHPDADQLTALMENSISGLERTQVLEHLAACGDCREVVFLALPQFDLEQARVASPVRSGWMRWPVLRWGAAAACVVVVGAAVTLHYHETPQEEAPMSVFLDSERRAELHAEAPPEKKSEGSASKSNALAVDDLAARKRSKIVADQDSKDKFAASFGDMRAAFDQSAASPAPKPLPQLKLSEQTATPKDESKKELERGQEADNARNSIRDDGAKAAPAAARVEQPAEVATGKAKEPLQKADESQVGSNEQVFRMARQAPAVAGGLILAPRWTLSAEGTLQRSLNGGKTWETISVASDANLRAVAAVGNEIWVAGDAGALYHSSDAGGRWTQVKPVAGGKPLSSDIIGLEFTDTQHGKLTTAGGDAWTTSDGGQSWNLHR